MDVMDHPADFWENRYAISDRVWSGRPNATLVDVVAALTPGRSLDLGCGEGADVIWLAQHGWQATGVDIAPSAIAHARDAAAALRLGDGGGGGSGGSIHFEVADLEAELDAELNAELDTELDAEQYDLVTACFLQSPVPLSREQILRRAAGRVSHGGRLLIVSHAVPPPWHAAAHHHETLPQPADDLAALALDPERWVVELEEIRRRDAVGPDGEPAVLDDGVLMVRRVG